MLKLRKLFGTTAPLAVMALVAAGCGGEGGSGEATDETEAAASMEHPVDEATAGSIAGRVAFTGTPATPGSIDMSDEPVCADKHAEPPTRQVAIVGPDGGLANVFVHITSGLDGMQFPADDPEVLDQEGCIYHPHVLALATGQDLQVRNSDDVLHNVNATPTENRGFNRSQPQADMEFTTSFAMPEVMIPVRCDVHGWMEAYIGVTDHPYHAVTGEDGSFSLDRLPPGDYEIQAWHEHYGTSSQTVTVPESGEVEVTFQFDETMAGRPVPMGPALIVDHETGTLRRAVAQDDQQ